ncbi:J domain-containing protein [Cetobacterium sp. ZOR0034]|uniref:J domain-containing protein n=1 Tax=Cetobacterium sp. ZOR0034 TaxID=1339239 RepID=UPI0026F3EB04|nr:DnaJ domain-containing protein [Cetobacterium sp. ZOR0034]
MISIALVLTAAIFLVIAILFGMNRAISALPALFFIMLLISFFGVMVIQFFPVILMFLVIRYFINKFINKKNPRKKTFYYQSYTQKDFEDMFRNQGNQYGGSYQGGYQNNPFGTFEDKSKYYAILGVKEGSTPEEIKKAYRELAKKHHPDRYANADAEIREMHERKFKEINEAYEKLQ